MAKEKGNGSMHSPLGKFLRTFEVSFIGKIMPLYVAKSPFAGPNQYIGPWPALLIRKLQFLFGNL